MRSQVVLSGCVIDARLDEAHTFAARQQLGTRQNREVNQRLKHDDGHVGRAKRGHIGKVRHAEALAIDGQKATQATIPPWKASDSFNACP